MEASCLLAKSADEKGKDPTKKTGKLSHFNEAKQNSIEKKTHFINGCHGRERGETSFHGIIFMYIHTSTTTKIQDGFLTSRHKILKVFF